ncbi:MAG: D-2-hydroxyacid dehydrogenase [Cryobacterium sp.]|nr:D-2-hydroxyacid dehydrogenase [Cryobacterium sp.]
MAEPERVKLRAVAAVPVSETFCQVVEELEPRVELLRDHSLMPPMRGPADWSGDPSFRRTPAQQARFESMVNSAEALFGVPDQDPLALARAVRSNPSLRWVMTSAAGGGSQVREANLSGADLERVFVTTSAGAHATPLAEFAVFGVLAGAKDLPRLQDDQSRKHWPSRWTMRHLEDMTVLVVGLGSIGRRCAQYFTALGATVWGTSRRDIAVDHVEKIVSAEALPEIVGSVDAIVVTLPGTESTFHLIDDRVLSKVRRGAILVSVGRGTVLDEIALLAALDDGRISFAALDVFEVEPLPQTSPLWAHPRVQISPHNAALSESEEARIARQFAANATRLIDGRPLRSVMNIREFY